jgi:hypothetical protein
MQAEESRQDDAVNISARSDLHRLPQRLRDLLHAEALIEALIDAEQGARALGLPLEVYRALTAPGGRVRRRVTGQVIGALLEGQDPGPIFLTGLPLPDTREALIQAAQTAGLAMLLRMQGGMMTRREFEGIEGAFGSRMARLAFELRQIAPVIDLSGRTRLPLDPAPTEELGYRIILHEANERLPLYARLLRIFMPASFVQRLDSGPANPADLAKGRAFQVLFDRVTSQFWHGHARLAQSAH